MQTHIHINMQVQIQLQMQTHTQIHIQIQTQIKLQIQIQMQIQMQTDTQIPIYIQTQIYICKAQANPNTQLCMRNQANNMAHITQKSEQLVLSVDSEFRHKNNVGCDFGAESDGTCKTETSQKQNTLYEKCSHF